MIYNARSYAINEAGKIGYSDMLSFKSGINWNRAANKGI
jgi:hypothetical protein